MLLKIMKRTIYLTVFCMKHWNRLNKIRVFIVFELHYTANKLFFVVLTIL